MNKDQSIENINRRRKNIPDTARHAPNNKLNTKLSTIYEKPKSTDIFSNSMYKPFHTAGLFL